MRRATGRCMTQIIREATHGLSVCSTSGRQAAAHIRSLSSRTRYDFYDPNDRDVYKEFQPLWDKANAAAAAAKAEAESEGRTVYVRHREIGRTHDKMAAPAAVPLNADADWPPGYGELLLSFLQQELPLNVEEAERLVAAARRGLLPASRELIRTRYMHIQDLEPRFPGFNAREAVLGEPRLLRHSASKLMHAMLVFQDQWTAHPVGPLMGVIGRYIVADPIGLGHRLHALSRAMAAEVGLALDPRRLTPGSVFLTASPYELDARVCAVATIFGRSGAQRLLATDLDVLRHGPQELNGIVIALREVFAVEGYGTREKYHLGTAEGAAAAAADRAYVTDLVVSWPGVLALPGRFGEVGLAQLVAAVQDAGGVRYRGVNGRSVLLADVLAQPGLLRVAAEAPGRLEDAVEEVVQALTAGPAEALGGMV